MPPEIIGDKNASLLPLVCERMQEEHLLASSTYLKGVIEKNPLLSTELFDLLESPTRQIHIPLYCLCKMIGLEENDAVSFEINQLKDEIDLLQSKQKWTIFTLGCFLDRLVHIQYTSRLCASLQDITRLIVLFQAPNCVSLLNLLSNSLPGAIWKTMLNLWTNNYGIKMDIIQDRTANLLASGSLDTIRDCLLEKSEKAKQDLCMLLVDLEMIQETKFALSPVQWQRIVAGKGSDQAALGIHSQVLQQVIANWLHVADNEDPFTVAQQIAATVNLLVIEAGWSFDQVKKILRFAVDTAEHRQNFLAALRIVYEYGQDVDVLSSIPFKFKPKDVRQLQKTVVQKVFGEKKKLLLEDAIYKVVKNAQMNPKSAITEQELAMACTCFQENYSEIERNCVNVAGLANKIKTVREKSYANLIKRPQIFSSRFESIAAAAFAVNKFFNISLREVQILSLIVACSARDVPAPRILQKETGEGKTHIVAALAVFEVLQGNQVDVITSSSELAQNQWNEMKGFYNSLGITVEHNAKNRAVDVFCGDREAILRKAQAANAGQYEECESKKQVYLADVVYGAASDFQADVLRQDFDEMILRFQRGFPVAIVDEVDSMFLDGRNDSVRLSSPSPGMSNLLAVQAVIWQQINNIYNQMEKEEGKWSYQSGEESIFFEHEYQLYDYCKDGTLVMMKKILGFAQLSQSERGGDKKWDEGDKKPDGKQMPFPRLEVPNYLRSIVEYELPKWIESAVKARFFMDIDFDYTMGSDKKLIVVDSANTGVHHPSMQWGHGLHQFLQMKHGLEIEPEALPTNFLSNVAFFLRYKENIVGLTGTIGGESSREFLKQVYGVDFVDIPPFMERRHLVLRPYIYPGEKFWLEMVTSNVAEKLRAGRAVLVITQYIHHASKIAAAISNEIEDGMHKVKLYTSRDTNVSINEVVRPGECIVATNIAGRGTDLKVSDAVLEMGGLHVVLTVLPETDRVQRQNIGRTSRTGQVGTSQLMINLAHLDIELLNRLADKVQPDNASQSHIIACLEKVRDDRVMKAVANAVKDLVKTKKADEALAEFISCRGQALKSYRGALETKEQKKISAQALNARFGRFLALTEEITKDGVKKEFKQADNPLDNPSAAVLYMQCLMPANPEEAKFKEAEGILDKAIDLDPTYAANAYYFRAALVLDKYIHNKGKSHLQKAIDDLSKCKKALDEQRLQYELLTQASMIKGEPQTLLAKQMERKMVIIDTIKANIDTMIGRNPDADIEYLKKEVAAKKELYENDRKEAIKKQLDALQKQLNDMQKDIEQIRKGALGMAYSTGGEIKITTKSLEESLPSSEKVSNYRNDLKDFEEDGFKILLTVNELKPRDWWAIAIVSGAAVLQIVGGCAAAVFTIGAAASVGWALLQEGVGDAIYAIKNGLIERNFNWTSYGLRKAISLAITIATFGFGAIKQAVKGAATGIKSGFKVLTGTAGIAKRVTQEGWKLALEAAAKTVTSEVSKVVVSKTFDYFCADYANNAIGEVICQAIQTALSQTLNNNSDVKTLLEWDNRHNNCKYAQEFSKEVMNLIPLAQRDGVLAELQDGIAALARKGFQSAGYENEVALFEKIAGRVDKALIVGKLTIMFCQLKDILTDIVSRNKNDEDGHQTNNSKRRNDVTYAGPGYTTVDEFFHVLSKQVATKLTPLLTAAVSNYVIGRIVDTGINAAWDVRGRVEQYRERFVNSEIVVSEAQKRLEGADDTTKETLQHIIGVAQDKPGDQLQAEYLANVVKQPIHIEITDNNGQTKTIIVGKQYNDRLPIELRFSTDGSGIGHYKLQDGTVVTPSGQYNCLFDAVSSVTNYDSALLRRATANIMLHHLDEVKNAYFVRRYDDLLVGGNAQRARSKSRDRHVRKVETLDDIFKKISEVVTARGAHQQKVTTLDDNDSSDFDRDCNEHFVNNPPVSPKKQVTYVRAETNLYQIHMLPPGYTQPKEIYVYRDRPSYQVDSTGAVHFNADHSQPSPRGYLIWTHATVVPGITKLEELFPPGFP